MGAQGDRDDDCLLAELRGGYRIIASAKGRNKLGGFVVVLGLSGFGSAFAILASDLNIEKAKEAESAARAAEAADLRKCPALRRAD